MSAFAYARSKIANDTTIHHHRTDKTRDISVRACRSLTRRTVTVSGGRDLSGRKEFHSLLRSPFLRPGDRRGRAPPSSLLVLPARGSFSRPAFRAMLRRYAATSRFSVTARRVPDARLKRHFFYILSCGICDVERNSSDVSEYNFTLWRNNEIQNNAVFAYDAHGCRVTRKTCLGRGNVQIGKSVSRKRAVRVLSHYYYGIKKRIR